MNTSDHRDNRDTWDNRMGSSAPVGPPTLWGTVFLIYHLLRLALVKAALLLLGVLRLVASPASSGRASDEFTDLFQPDRPDNQMLRRSGSDGFWQMYYQAYSPRLWRMRRLLPLATGRDLKKQSPEDESGG